MSSNGKLPSNALKNIPGGRLEINAANSWLDMRAHIHNKTGLWIAPGGPRSSYRTYQEQVYFWNLFKAGKGNPAAYPSTSNHGWGKAVDVPNYNQQQAILKYGPQFGWSWAEGKRVGEPWHFTYVGGRYKRKVDPLKSLTKQERGWVSEYVKLKKANKNRPRRVRLRAAMRKRRRQLLKLTQTNQRKQRQKILAKYS